MSNFVNNIQSYLGPKGYSIYKDSITVDIQHKIRGELTVKPNMPKTSMVQPKEFPIYRESPKKLYVPRFYGENLYGKCNDSTLGEGTDITIEFTGELRDFQKPIVDKYIKNAKQNGGGLLEIPCGFGKTVMALKIISELKKKTIVIVHKEFLLQQWVERIKEFLPDARIGRIQGEKYLDVENKDIVIGMLQSLSMKTYPDSLFKEFGLTIIDETHHIGAEVFSNALFQIVTPYMLGLSATMTRKDGLSKVFKMFIGEVIYKLKRESDDNVIIQNINYINEDEEFGETVYNFKGQTHYAIMIKKLCEFNPRCEFILTVLRELLKDDKNKQIMILAHNKNLLIYLYNSIEHKKIATVGYYIGGMKQDKLKLSEDKKVIIATYAMAEEALDIKTLSTLIMATPKTDVTQAVGRILRTKHEQAIVVDIVDQHDIFKRQWKKRESFYKKNDYKILTTSSNIYGSNCWHTSYDPKNKEHKKSKKDNIGEKDLKGKCLLNSNDL